MLPCFWSSGLITLLKSTHASDILLCCSVILFFELMACTGNLCLVRVQGEQETFSSAVLQGIRESFRLEMTFKILESGRSAWDFPLVWILYLS